MILISVWPLSSPPPDHGGLTGLLSLGGVITPCWTWNTCKLTFCVRLRPPKVRWSRFSVQMFSGQTARNTELRANSCISMSQATFKIDEKSIPSVTRAGYYFAAPGSWKALLVPKPVKVICLCRPQDDGNPPWAPRAAPVQRWWAPRAAVTTGDRLISGFRCFLSTQRSWKCLRSNIVEVLLILWLRAVAAWLAVINYLSFPMNFKHQSVLSWSVLRVFL